MDAAGWDERYGAAELVWSAEPNRFVAELVADLPPGRAIDLAAGEGRNGLWLAGLGWTVTAVDFSEVGLAKGRRLAERLELTERLTFECADLTRYVPEPGGYDLVLLVYLHLPAAERQLVVRRAADAVAPGGTLLIVGHDLANLERGVGGPQDPDVLYTADRLRDAIAGSGLTVVEAGERLRPVDGAERPAVDVVLLARRARRPRGQAAKVGQGWGMSNRLAQAQSPYLQQHADNPVDWQEWGPEAFAEARERDVPILLSVGYAACHWCHVMAHESFEDAETAELMNAGFVNIKVDREERPDVDAVYMEATQAFTGQGGWPMTCLLTADGEPIFCGTYFPRAQFQQLLRNATQAWSTQREAVLEQGADIARQLREQLGSLDGAGLLPEADALDAAVEALAGEFDQRFAGFGRAPKFPPSMLLEFLLRAYARGGDDRALDMVARTCQAMARGGMYDQLAGGFARYSVDAAWVVPHFEKMLYDNALLLRAYLHWWRISRDPLAERVVRETIAFLLRDLRTPEGGFASSLDADAAGSEGSTYVWTPAQLTGVLGPDDGEWAAGLCAVTREGTFEHGASTLQLPGDPIEPARWERIRTTLLGARAERVQPPRDDKVVASWNGWTISALAEAGALLDEPEWVAAAQRAGSLLRDLHLVDGRLRRVSRDGTVGSAAGALEDYGAVASGWITLYEVTGATSWLEAAGGLLDAALADFPDGAGGFFDAAAASDGVPMLRRPQDPTDNATPSGASALCGALVSYAALTGALDYREAAETALAKVMPLIAKHPRFAGEAAAVAEAMIAGPAEVAVVGRPDLERLARLSPSPGAVVVTTGPLTDGRPEPAVYICRHFTCERPLTDPAEVAARLGVTSGV